MTANIISVKILLNKVNIIEVDCISNLSLNWWQWLLEKIKRFGFIFSIVEKLSKSPFRQLLYSIMAKAKLIFLSFLRLGKYIFQAYNLVDQLSSYNNLKEVLSRVP